MKKIIALLIFLFSSVLFAQKKEYDKYNFKTVAGVLAFQIDNYDVGFPDGKEKEIIQLLIQFQQSKSYKQASTTDKLMVNAALSQLYIEILDLKESDKYIKKYIDMYEAGFEKNNNRKENNSLNYLYRNYLLYYAETLSLNSTNLNDILLCLNKAKKVKIDFEKPGSFNNMILLYEGNAYGNALYYDKAIKTIQSAIYNLKKYPQDKKSNKMITYCYYKINSYILEKIVKKKTSKKEEMMLLKDIDKNVLEVERINDEDTNWTTIYSLKAYADYLRNDFASANKYLEKALTRPSKENYFYEYDYLLPKMYKLLILVKTKDYIAVEALRKEIEGDAYFKDLINNIDYKSDLKDYYSALIVYEKDQKNYQEALAYTEKRQPLIDDNRDEELNAQLKEFENKQKMLQKELKTSQLSDKKKQLIIFLIILNYLFLLFIAFGFFYIRKKRKESDLLFSKIKDVTENQINKINFAKQEALKELKKQFSMQLHTEVGSMLIATVNFLKVKKKIDQKLEDQQLWDSMIKELEKIYKTIRQESHDIYENSLSNQQFLVELEKNIQLIFNATNSFKLHTCIDINESTALNVDTKLSIITLIKEGCTNIIKHSKAKNIYINLVENDTSIILEIKDDGKQKLLNNNKKIGIGLYSLKEMILKMNGNLHFGKRINCDGFEIIASFPK